jgi:7-carboxy-7-deazaguanine synthase
MRIAEIFHSIQGEGLLAGVPSIFIRTSGCNLRCHWCDTPYASWKPEGPEMSIEEILKKISEWNCHHIVLTGGEPMIAPDLPELATALKKQKKHITIETAGTIPPNGIPCDLASLSPKLTNSTPSAERDPAWAKKHEANRLQPEVISDWIRNYNFQLKFVVSSENDLVEISPVPPRNLRSTSAPVGSGRRRSACPLPPGAPHARRHRCENTRHPLPVAGRNLPT